MTRPRKLILAGVLLASAGAIALPTLAAQIPADTSKDGAQVTQIGKDQQVAFGDWDRGGPRHFGPRGMMGGPGGPGGPGGMMGGPGGMMGGPGGPGGMMGGPGGPGFAREGMYNRLLELLGVNDDGKVTQAQIDSAVAEKFKSYDKNGDGKITLDEYQAFWLDLTHERMVRSFQHLDREGAGAITADEVTKPLDRMLGRLDRNDDGIINQADFQRGHRHWDGPNGPQGPGGPGQPPPAPPAQ